MNYALQACLNLAAEFTLRGDRDAVRYFQGRIRAIKRASAKPATSNQQPATR